MTTSADSAVAETHARLAPARARLLARDDEIVRLQAQLAEIPAPTGEEGERARHVAALLARAGLRGVEIDAAGNARGLRPGSEDGEPVVVCAHLDTVFPRGTPLDVRRVGTRLEGPGIADNGRGLAVMLALAAELDGERVRTRRPVLFAATTGEEGPGDLCGARALFAGAAAGAHAAIIVDGPGDDRVVHTALGVRRYRVTFTGPGGHSWSGHGAPNPVHAAAAAAARLAALPLPAAPRTTLSVTRIGGGLAVNAIPTEAWLEVDIRSTGAAPLERLSAAVATAARRAAAEEDARRAPIHAPLSVSVVRTGDRPGGAVLQGHRLVQDAFDATLLIGRTPRGAVASTDANVPIALGIPAVAIGGGGTGGAVHTTEEWYDNTDGPLGIARALTLVVAAAGME